mgnify:CR=1 FL=1
MPVKKLKDYLDSNKIRYQTINHSTAYTAQQIAASAHIPGRELAKTVMVKIDDKMAMTVLPASYKVDFDLLKEVVGTNNVALASEKEFKDCFPDCEIGAMPPFGNLWEMDVYVAESLLEDEEIAFNACSHTELIKMKFADFEKLVKPKRIKFSVPSKT